MNNDTALSFTNSDRLLKAVDVAMRLNVSRTEAYRLMRSDIPVIRFGSSTVRVRPADLENFVTSHLTGGNHDQH